MSVGIKTILKPFDKIEETSPYADEVRLRHAIALSTWAMVLSSELLSNKRI